MSPEAFTMMSEGLQNNVRLTDLFFTHNNI